MLVKHWKEPQAIEWAALLAGLAYFYVLFWFWKLRRAEWVAQRFEEGVAEQGKKERLRFWGAATLSGVLYVAAVWLTARIEASVMVRFGWVIGVFVFGLGLSGLGLVLLWRTGRGKRAGMLQQMFTYRSARKQVTRFVLVLLSLALLVVAMMRPQGEGKQREIKRQGVDIVFAVDLSPSMLAEDVKPNRLDAVKDEIARILDRLSGDRVGLVVFTAAAFRQSPPTSDYGAIEVFLDKIDPSMMPAAGTAIGRALWEGIGMLTGRDPLEPPTEVETSPLPKHAQLIVLFTDGEDHETDSVAVAQEAQSYGIQIYTVGVGTSSGATIPEYDEEGLPSGVMVRKGAPVETRLDAGMLQQIAEATGGAYYEYKGPGTVAQALTDELSRLQKAELESLLERSYEDYYYLILIPAALLLVLVSLIGERRRPSKGAKLGAVLSILLALCGCGDELLERPHPEVEAGNQALDEGDPEAALSHYQAALEALPDEPMIHYNIGLAHLKAGEREAAKQSLVRALAVSPDAREDRVRVLLALGDTLFEEATETQDDGLREALYREALRNFRQALEINPDDEDLRKNLELTLHRLFPSCAGFEDRFEENDSIEEATVLPLEELTTASFTLCGRDDDVFALPAGTGYQVDVEVQMVPLPRKREPMDDSARLDYGRIEMMLLDMEGEILTEAELPPLPMERAATGPTKAKRNIDAFVIPEPVGEGPVFLKLSGRDFEEAAYQISVVLRPPCAASEDEHEENDSRERASTLPNGEHLLHICNDDEDWFSFELGVGDALFIDGASLPNPSTGRPPLLEYAFFDGDQVLAQGTMSPEAQQFELGVRERLRSGRVDLMIRGLKDEDEGPYGLSIHHFKPCPAGDDGFEENDTPETSAALPEDQKNFRHLRLCDAEEDWYIATVPPPQTPGAHMSNPAIGAQVGFTASIEYDARYGDLALVAQDPVTAEVLAVGEVAASERPFHQVQTFSLEGAVVGERIQLHISGDPNFYHLSLETPDQSDSNSKNEEEEEDQNEDEQNKDEEDKDQESENESDDPQEKQDDPSKGQDQNDQQNAGDQDEENKGEGMSPDALKERRMNDLLDRLEQEDQNLPLKRAKDEMNRQWSSHDW